MTRDRENSLDTPAQRHVYYGNVKLFITERSHDVQTTLHLGALRELTNNVIHERSRKVCESPVAVAMYFPVSYGIAFSQMAKGVEESISFFMSFSLQSSRDGEHHITNNRPFTD